MERTAFSVGKYFRWVNISREGGRTAGFVSARTAVSLYFRFIHDAVEELYGGVLRGPHSEMEAIFVKKFVAAMLTLIFVMVGEASLAADYTFSITNDSAEDTVTQLLSLKLKGLFEERSGGKIKANVYPSGQMGKDSELTQSTQAGDIAFVVQNTAPQINFVPEVAVFDLPFLFANSKVARAVLDSEFKDLMATKYDKVNLRLMGYCDQGFRVVTTNKAVKSPEDFKGVKIRTMENKYHVANWRAQGANPTPLPWGEVYIALQQGIIDGQENPYEVIVAAKLYEQQKYIVNTNHIFHTISVVMSKKIYEELPADLQKLVTEACKDAIDWGREQADKRHSDRVNILRENKVEIVDFTDEQLVQMQKAAEPVYAMVREAVGDELVDAALAEVKKAQGK